MGVDAGGGRVEVGREYGENEERWGNGWKKDGKRKGEMEEGMDRCIWIVYALCCLDRCRSYGFVE